jgi:serine/threonine protein kinase
MEHVIPLVKGEERGGTHDLGNILPACVACNYKKFNYGLLTFAQRHDVCFRSALLKADVNTLARNEIIRGMRVKRSKISLDPDKKEQVIEEEREITEISERFVVSVDNFSSILESNSTRVLDATTSVRFLKEKPQDEVPIVDMSLYWAKEEERKGVKALERIPKEYMLISMIGSGGFGAVWFACHIKSNDFCALKIIPFKNSKEKQEALHEASTLQALDHPSIVKLRQVFDDEERESGRTYVVMEMECFPRNLQEFIKTNPNNSQELILQLLLQLTVAIEYLHSKDKAHRDIKPANVLLCGDESNMQVKLTDFGLSRDAANTQAHTIAGTPPYMPPEILSGSYDAKEADIYSLGCLATALITGVLLEDKNYSFNEKTTKLIEDIRNQNKNSGLTALVEEMLSNIPQHRPSASYIKIRLQHLLQKTLSDIPGKIPTEQQSHICCRAAVSCSCKDSF